MTAPNLGECCDHPEPYATSVLGGWKCRNCGAESPAMTYVLSCPYCAVKVVGDTMEKAWVRWLMEHYAHKHQETNGAVSPDEMEWEKVPKP